MLTVIIIVICVLIILSLAVGAGLFHFAIVRKKPMPDNAPEKMRAAHAEGERLLAALPNEKLSITSKDGLKLYGEYYPAAQPTNKTALCVHGYLSNGHLDYRLFASIYRDMGYNMLVVDDRAHGKSEGRYIGFGWLDKDDVIMWAQKLVQNNPQCEIVLAGVSMGAATVLMAGGCEALPANVKAIVADCAYTSAYDEFAHQLHEYFHLPREPFLTAASLISRIFAHYGFKQANTTAQVRKIKVPVMFIHGDADKYVPTYMAQQLYTACKTKKRLLIIENAGHAMSLLTNPEEYTNAVREFLG